MRALCGCSDAWGCARRRSNFLLRHQKKVTKEKATPLSATPRVARGNLWCSTQAGSCSNSHLRCSDNRKPFSASACAPRRRHRGFGGGQPTTNNQQPTTSGQRSKVESHLANESTLHSALVICTLSPWERVGVRAVGLMSAYALSQSGRDPRLPLATKSTPVARGKPSPQPSPRGRGSQSEVQCSSGLCCPPIHPQASTLQLGNRCAAGTKFKQSRQRSRPRNRFKPAVYD